MKIALVSPFITTAHAPESYYNVQSFALARSLSQNDVTVDILTSRKPGDPEDKFISVGDGRGFRVRYFHSVLIHPQFPLMGLGFLGALRAGRYDVIQVSEDFQFSSILVILLRKVLGSRVVIYQGLYRYPPRPPFEGFLRLFDRLFLGISRRNTDAVVCKTTEAAKFMDGKGYRNVVRIPPGIDTTLFAPSSHAPRPPIPSVIHIGPIESFRAPMVLVKMLDEMRTRNLRIKLICIGNGNMKSRILEELKSRNLEDWVDFRDKVPNNEIVEVYGSVDALVLPMDKETIFIFGMVLLEALSCGVPVISSPVPGAVDLISDRENGYIVPFGDDTGFADSLERIVRDDENRANMRTRARMSVAPSYDLSSVGIRFMNLYREICGRN